MPRIPRVPRLAGGLLSVAFTLATLVVVLMAGRLPAAGRQDARPQPAHFSPQSHHFTHRIFACVRQNGLAFVIHCVQARADAFGIALRFVLGLMSGIPGRLQLALDPADYLLAVAVESLDASQRFFTERLGELPGVASLKSLITMKAVKKTSALPV